MRKRAVLAQLELGPVRCVTDSARWSNMAIEAQLRGRRDMVFI